DRTRRRSTKQLFDPFEHEPCGFLIGDAQPMNRRERIRYLRILLPRVIDAHGHEERPAATHQVRALIGQPPFEAKVTLGARLRVARDDGHEERAIADLLADTLIPSISPAKLAP